MNGHELISHYTTLDGFKSIIGSNRIWASNVHFLNDRKEYYHTFDIFRKAFEKFCDSFDTSIKLNQYFVSGLQRCLDGMDSIGADQHFITSFSKNLDQLSQWRGYGSVGIVFSREELEADILDLSGYAKVEDCCYSSEKLSESFSNKIDQLFYSYIKEVPDKGVDEIFNLAVDLQIYLYDAAAFNKDSGFQEEAEVRLSYGVAGDEEIKFRAADTHLIPYIEIPFRLSSINSIIIGPCVEPDRSEKSIDLFLRKYFKNNPPAIIHSTTPYRSW